MTPGEILRAARKKIEKPVLDRFEEKFIPEPNSGCWLWIGAADARGYGNFWHCGQLQKAHRVSWEIATGGAAGGLMVLHRCDVPCCVNPGHLFLGTALDNMQDMYGKGRSRHVRGERVARAKLTASAVAEIKGCRLGDLSERRRLAAKYGVSEGAIEDIRDGKTWRHIPDRAIALAEEEGE